MLVKFASHDYSYHKSVGKPSMNTQVLGYESPGSRFYSLLCHHSVNSIGFLLIHIEIKIKMFKSFLNVLRQIAEEHGAKLKQNTHS